VAKTTTRTKPRPVRPEIPQPKFARPALVAAPAPTPATPPRPRGVLDAASVDEIRQAAAETWPAPVDRRRSRDRGLRRLLAHLASFPGHTWQERWEASGLNERGRPVRDLADTDLRRTEMIQALEALFFLRIVQPTLECFRSNHFVKISETFRIAQRDEQLDAYFAAVAGNAVSPHFKQRALFDVCCALTTQGIAFAALTAEAFLHYAQSTRNSGLASYSYATYVGHLAWQVMHETGHFPRSTPSTLRAALRASQLGPAELVSQYDMANGQVRQLLTDYLERRGHDLDYSSLSSLASTLALVFWKTVEKINPEQADLRLSEDTYQAWRAAITVRGDGKPRAGQDSVLMAVRALYFDIQSWATQEPERWAVWAAPCPIPMREIRAGSKRRRRVRERMADRVRTLQPMLPLLVEYIDASHRRLAELLDAAAKARPDEHVAVGSRLYCRLFTPGDHARQRRHGEANVRVRDVATGEVINVTLAEDTAFWEWAIIETLRHTGVRIEELTELSQLSILQYQRPNGEVIALLVIAPSKADRERVIPMSAELFHVVACILRRLTRNRATVPLATRYDIFERITSDPQPFLFQRHIGQRNEVMTPGAVRELLRRTCGKVAELHPEFAGHHFTPHDFRRLFATDLVNHGLPIHIGAALLGHLNLETTRGYVAVFQEDVVRHYQGHLARRRAMRPDHEYRPVTETEWTEFEEHFDKRKLELGSCGRPYATPCSHEHACIRCPMLQVDPKMLGRLEEIETDLLARRAHAEAEGWLGELEGIDLTLTFLGSKREEAIRISSRGPIALGLPTRRDRAKS
jgi:integrase